LAKFIEMAREMISSVSTETKTKNANLYRDEIKKHKHQILNFKNKKCAKLQEPEIAKKI